MQRSAYRFQLLAPYDVRLSTQKDSKKSNELYARHLHSLQQLRGSAYLQDGAIQPWSLDKYGRHRMSDDEKCWHFLMVDSQGHAIGCARYLVHSPDATYNQLRISQSPLAQDPFWGSELRLAVENTLQGARDQQVRYAELGGWAIADEYRNTKAALEILLGSYVWAEMIGHCMCSCTATVRNRSSSILRRMGAGSLAHNGEMLPSYFDARYGCTMELLSFDSRQLPSRFAPLVDEMRPKFLESPIIQRSSSEEISFSSELDSLQSSIAGLYASGVAREPSTKEKTRLHVPSASDSVRKTPKVSSQ